MRAKFLVTAATLALITALPVGPAEAAKVCKDPLSAKSSSRIQGSDEARETRARDNAIKRWNASAQQTHGIAFKYWWRADDKKVECGGTAKTKHCTVTAKPCRIY